MVRMCELMTFACATALVAGSVASAADKVERADIAKDQKVQSIGSARSYAKNIVTDSSVFGLGSGCSCEGWDNGRFDPATGDGQVSHLGGAVTYGAKAADDFYLCEGFVYQLNSITVTLLTSSIEQLAKAKLELYADCDGCPGDLLYTFEKSSYSTSQGTWGTDPSGNPIRIHQVTFRPQASEPQKAARNVVLHGGAYWISAYGLTDNQCPMNMCDVTFWGTAPRGTIKGSVAKKSDGVPCSSQTSWGQYCFGPWRSVEECCVGCTDLSFTVCARECKILVDNGFENRAVTPAGSPSLFAPFTTFDSRSADDFVVPPCSPVTLCYIEGCIYTNCAENLLKGYFEIYGNDCKVPAYALAGTQNGNTANGPVIASGEATKVVYLGYSVTIDGRSLRAYRLEFHNLNATLPGGTQLWISLMTKFTGSSNERTYFCFNDKCDGCLINWNPGQYLARPVGMPMAPDWVSAGKDFAFLIAIDRTPTAGSGAATPTCVADFDRSGGVTVDDLFGFLNAWFTGCP
jgi:hypothetical protein